MSKLQEWRSKEQHNYSVRGVRTPGSVTSRLAEGTFLTFSLSLPSVDRHGLTLFLCSTHVIPPPPLGLAVTVPFLREADVT